MALPVDPIAWAVAQFKDATQASRYTDYAAYYDGNQRLKLVTPKLAEQLRGIYDALTYNRCSVVVDSIADRLRLRTFFDGQGQSVQAANDLWSENRMDKREGEVNQEALIAGDAYIIVWPNVRTGRPTIWPEPAASMRVLYDDEEPDRLVMAAKYWTSADGYGRLNLYLPDRLEKYITKNKATGGIPDATAFTAYQPEGDTEWPLRYTWFRDNAVNLPVFHFANNARTGRYGRSELRDVIPLQDGINTSLAKLMTASDDAAGSRVVFTGWTPNKRNDATGKVDDPFFKPARPFENVNERYAAFPSKDTGVFVIPAIDLAQLIAVGEAFDLMIARTSRIPVHYLGMTGSFPSGESLKTADAPLVKKVVDRQTAFGNDWEDAIALGMRMQGIDLTFQVNAVYESAEPRSEREMAEIAVNMKTAGLPLAAILRLAFKLTQDEVQVVLQEAEAVVEQMRAQFNLDAALPGDNQSATEAA